MRKKMSEHPIEEIGVKLRGMMPLDPLARAGRPHAQLAFAEDEAAA
jgi:hypothetical protein